MLTRISGPLMYPITLAEAKAQCRVTGDREDDEIRRFIASATEDMEGRIRRALITRSYALDIPRWPDEPWPDSPASVRLRRCVDVFGDGSVIRLPRPPLGRVTSIEGIRATSPSFIEVRLFPPDGYHLDSGLIHWNTGDWPELRPDERVRIAFDAGYGASDSTIPADIRRVLRVMVAADYYERLGTMENTVRPAPYIDRTCRRYEARWSI